MAEEYNSTEEMMDREAEAPVAENSIEEENRRLKEENERLRKAEEERIANLAPKERLYEKINVSLRTMNIIVGILFVILAVVMILALLDR